MRVVAKTPYGACAWSLPDSGMVVLVGPHRSGKSTLVNSLRLAGVEEIHAEGLYDIAGRDLSLPQRFVVERVEGPHHPKRLLDLLWTLSKWTSMSELRLAVMTTYSPIVLDFFNKKPENVFVMTAGYGFNEHCYGPVRLVDRFHPDWLSQFSLGDLFAKGEIGW